MIRRKQNKCKLDYGVSWEYEPKPIQDIDSLLKKIYEILLNENETNNERRENGRESL